MVEYGIFIRNIDQVLPQKPVIYNQAMIWYTVGHSDWEQAEKLIKVSSVQVTFHFMPLQGFKS